MCARGIDAPLSDFHLPPSPLTHTSIHTHAQDKLAYVVSAVESCWAAGRPVLIGTSSVNESELVLRVLQEWCSPVFRPLAARVQLLNAKPENVRLEAQVGVWGGVGWGVVAVGRRGWGSMFGEVV